MTAEVRRLGAGDHAAFLDMLALFADVFDEPESYLSRQPSSAYIAARLADPGFFALVAETGGAMVGALAGYALHKFEQERSEFYIYDLGVLESHRRQGVATGLIAGFSRLAAEQNGWVVFVQADYGDAPAIALYSKLGKREEVLHFDIEPKA